MSRIDIVVAHPFQQHSYHNAIAAQRAGMQYRYVTSIYQKKGSLVSCLSWLLKGENLRRSLARKCDEIDDNNVVLLRQFSALLVILIRKIFGERFLYFWAYKRHIRGFNRSLFRFCLKNKVKKVVVFDTLSFSFIKRNEKHKVVEVILDMSAPSLPFIIQRLKSTRSSFNERYYEKELLSEILKFEKEEKQAIYEITHCDVILAASELTRASVFPMNNRVEIARYGLPDSCDRNYPACFDKNGVIFVGTLSINKGFDRFSKIASLWHNDERSKSECFFAAGTKKLAQATNDIVLLGHLEKKDLFAYLSSAKVLLFLSNYDGYGFSVLEAMNYGVVPIVSHYAGIADLIEDGENGFVVDPDDTPRIVDILASVLGDSVFARKLAMNAIKTARAQKWEDYYGMLKMVYEK